MLDEAERSLHDALCVLSQTVQDARVVYGGGFPEMQMAKVSHCHIIPSRVFDKPTMTITGCCCRRSCGVCDLCSLLCISSSTAPGEHVGRDPRACNRVRGGEDK